MFREQHVAPRGKYVWPIALQPHAVTHHCEHRRLNCGAVASDLEIHLITPPFDWAHVVLMCTKALWWLRSKTVRSLNIDVLMVEACIAAMSRTVRSSDASH